MHTSAIAKRYAQAVFEIARETEQFDRWMADLQELAATLHEEQLAALLESPKVRFEDRKRLLTARLADLSPLALNLGLLLTSKGRFSIVGQVRDEYEKLLSSRTRLVAVCHVSNAFQTMRRGNFHCVPIGFLKILCDINGYGAVDDNGSIFPSCFSAQ